MRAKALTAGIWLWRAANNVARRLPARVSDTLLFHPATGLDILCRKELPEGGDPGRRWEHLILPFHLARSSPSGLDTERDCQVLPAGASLTLPPRSGTYIKFWFQCGAAMATLL